MGIVDSIPVSAFGYCPLPFNRQLDKFRRCLCLDDRLPNRIGQIGQNGVSYLPKFHRKEGKDWPLIDRL
jgi:hypothetical protein